MITKFQERVYAIVSKIPKGKTMTYGQIAKKLDSSPRAVGQALKRNPDLKKVKCYRVIKSDSSIGGYCGRDTKKIKLKTILLKKEQLH